MKFQVSDGEQYQKIMEAEVAAEEMELALRQASKRLANKVNIPGFRKGKAPQSIIENFVGLDSILQEAADDLLPQAYFRGLQELGLEPVEQPKLEMVQLAVGQPMIFKATFTVKPEVKLGQYKGLAFTKTIKEPSEKDIAGDIDTQRQRLARTEPRLPGDTAELHDTVIIDFEGFRDGIPFEGGKAEKYPLTLGSFSFIPGFEEQLVGVDAGDELDVNVTFPENYQEPSLAGQPAVFKVKVHEVRQRVLPELNDELAQELSETAETVEDLRQESRERLLKRNAEAANSEARERALELAVENAEIDLPPLMIEQRMDDMVQSMHNRLQIDGLNMEDFLHITDQTPEQFREGYREHAEKSVRSDLVLEAVAQEEKIAVSEEDVEQELKMMSAHYHQPLEQIRKVIMDNNRMDVLKDEIRLKKTVNFIYESSEISEEIEDTEAGV